MYTWFMILNAQSGSSVLEMSERHSKQPPYYTIYCPHGVMLWLWGDEKMWNTHSESSPHIFWSLQKQLYMTMHANCTSTPSMENQNYVYKNSRFFVDRFHWRGHIGCSEGYSLDSYKSLNSNSARINSQINKQANSGLQRIKGQLAYIYIGSLKTLSLLSLYFGL